MQFYEADMSVKNSRIHYGSLPLNFVIGVENTDTNKAYFTLLDEVALPEDVEGVISVSEEIYNEQVELNVAKAADQRQKDFDDTIKQVQDKNQRLVSIEEENARLILANAIQETRITNMENENASILLELATIKGGI